MPKKKLVTMQAPDGYKPEVESTGFAAENIVRTLNARTDPTELEIFEDAREHARAAEYRIKVLAADLDRHILSLRENVRIRTAERQAQLSLDDLELLMQDLQKVGYVLLKVRDDRLCVGEQHSTNDDAETARRQAGMT